jgi:hypothetical protein
VRKHLDSDVAIKLRISGPVDLAHAARTDGREDFAGTEAVTHRERHRSFNDFIARGALEAGSGRKAPESR